jgi:hypothetical protein
MVYESLGRTLWRWLRVFFYEPEEDASETWRAVWCFAAAQIERDEDAA